MADPTLTNLNLVTSLTAATTPAPQTPSLVAALQSFLTGSSVPSVPQALLSQPPGQIITAVVLAANPRGQVLLQTPQGQVVFSSSLPLSVGQQLALQTLSLPQTQTVPGAAAPTQAQLPYDVQLVRVNGIPAQNVFAAAAGSATNTPDTSKTPVALQQPQQQVAQVAESAAVSPLTLRAVFPEPQRPGLQNKGVSSGSSAQIFEADAVEYNPSPLQTRATFRATVLNTPSENPQVDATAAALRGISEEEEIPAPLSQLKTGDVLTVKITGGTLATPTTTATTAETGAQLPLLTNAFQQAANPQTATQQQEPAANTTIATAQTAPATLATPAEVDPYDVFSKPAAPEPQPQTTATQNANTTAVSTTANAAGNTPAPTLPGIVIAQEPDGSAVVQTPVATLRLPPDVPLPRGTQIALQVSDIEPALDLFAANQLPTSFQTGNPATDALIRGSTSLDTLFKQLAGLSSATAKETARGMIPQPGRDFGSKVLQFIASMKQDAVPDTMRAAIPREMSEQMNINRTTQEFTGLKTAMAEAPPPQWSYMLIPVMQQGEDMQHMRWFKRKQERDDGRSDSGDGTRFVVELETKSLGQIQLDGLFFNQPKSKEFDLVIRSQKGFSQAEQQEISQIYNNYGEITGYRGSLRFEQTQAFPVHPLSDIVEGESREISA